MISFAIQGDADNSPSPGPTIALDVSRGEPGTSVTIRGAGFPPLTVVALYIDAPGPYLDIPGPRTDSQGRFVKKFTWPASDYDKTGRVKPDVAGTHNVCGDTVYPGSSQSQSVRMCVQFLVERSASSTPSNPAAGGTASSGTIIAALIAFALVAGLGVAVITSMRKQT